MTQHEIRTASRRILGYLEDHGEAPILVMKDDLRDPQLQFYMGLGDLILQGRVTFHEHQGAFWATQSASDGRAT
jgi:hypothetical protein